MKTRPLILIAGGTDPEGPEFRDPSLTLSGRYSEAVLAHGGLPLVLPPLPAPRYLTECVRRADGAMLSGGDDLQPGLHTSEVAPALEATVKRVDPARDFAETLLINEVFRLRKPLLAICRGHQMLNVVFGGDLYVDLETERPDAEQHRRFDQADEAVQEVTLSPGTLLRRLLGRARARVNTTHHQAVRRLAGLFRRSATSADGIVEAFELAPEHAGLLPWLVSVQFHPERLWRQHPEFSRLFRSFIRAAKAARSGSGNVVEKSDKGGDR